MSAGSDKTGRKRLCYKNKMILAPMVKIGTTPFRLMALEYGADIVYTEEIIDWRLLRSDRIINPVLNTVDYVDRTDDTLVLRISDKEKGRVVLQIGTSDAQRAVKVAKMVVDDVDGLDVNMGCPKSFSLKGGMGAALLTQPDKVQDILTSLVKTVGSKIPVTCKIRILKDRQQTLDLVKIIEGTGVDALAVHGRTKEERPNDSVHLDEIRAVVNHVDMTVISNGGSSNNRDSSINTHQGIKDFWKETGSSSIMIARAAEWNPSVFRAGDKVQTMDLVHKYLNHAIFYDYTFGVVKYTVQQLLGSLQDSPMGKQFLASATMKDLCAVFGRDKELEERQAWIRQESERLGFGTERESANKRKEISMRTELLSDTDQLWVRNLKEIRLSGELDDESLANQLKDLEEKTPVFEMNARFVRGHFTNDTDIPKSKLLMWTRKHCCGSTEVAAEFHPVYKTWGRDKFFRSLVHLSFPSDLQLPNELKTAKEAVFSSLALEKNKRYSEQAAAKVALDCIRGHHDSGPNPKRLKLLDS